MAARPPPRPPAPPAARSLFDRLQPAWVVAGLLTVVGLPAALAMGAAWAPWADAGTAAGAAPVWLTPPTVRATLGNGAVVKARVALDAPDADTRALLNSRTGQVALLLQISVAEYVDVAGSGSDRVQHMEDEIRTRLNDFLAAGQVPPVRDVVIQDLVLSKP